MMDRNLPPGIKTYKRKKRIHYISNVASAKRMQARRLSPSAMHNLYLHTYTCAYRYLRARTIAVATPRAKPEKEKSTEYHLSFQEEDTARILLSRLRHGGTTPTVLASRYRDIDVEKVGDLLNVYPLSLSFA